MPRRVATTPAAALELEKGDAIIREGDRLLAEAIRIVAGLYGDGTLRQPEHYAQPFPDLLAFHDAPTPIEQKLFVMRLEHRMRLFQGTFHAYPDDALWYGWSEMLRDLTEIREMAAAPGRPPGSLRAGRVLDPQGSPDTGGEHLGAGLDGHPPDVGHAGEGETAATRIEKVVAEIPGTRSAFADRPTGGFYVDIRIDREAAARYHLRAGDINDLERYPISVRSPPPWWEGSSAPSSCS